MSATARLRAALGVLAAALATTAVLAGTAWVAREAGGPPGRDLDRGPGLREEAPADVSVIAYALASTSSGPRLVAERRTVPDVGSVLRSALLATLDGTVDDRTHEPVWPDAPDLDVDVTVEGDLVEVALRTPDGLDGSATPAPPEVGQALAWTVASATGNEFLVVDLTVDGGDPRRLLPGVTGPVKPARDARVLAPVVLTSVGEFEPVESPVPVAGLATGAVTWELLLGTEVVDRGVARTERPGQPSPFAAEARAGRGEHLLRVSVTDPRTGATYVETTRFAVD
ncbi:hypothetical protein [Nocardioides marmoraquaticus]